MRALLDLQVMFAQHNSDRRMVPGARSGDVDAAEKDDGLAHPLALRVDVRGIRVVLNLPVGSGSVRCDLAPAAERRHKGSRTGPGHLALDRTRGGRIEGCAGLGWRRR